MNTSGWRWVGSVPSMQGEISHWWPLTDGGLTARCNTDPREYQVSPHYTLHRLFQLPMLPPLIGRHAQNNIETLLLKNIKSSLFNLTFLPCITVCLGMLSLIIFSSVFFDNFYSLVLSTVSLEKKQSLHHLSLALWKIALLYFHRVALHTQSVWRARFFCC